MFNLQIILILAVYSSAENILSSNVMIFELNSETLPQTNHGLWLLEFYATWCSHCRHLELVYQEVAEVLHQLLPTVRVAKIDAPQNPQGVAQFRVRGYPTLIFLKNGVKYEYNEERTTIQLVKFVQRICGAAVKSLHDYEELKTQLKEHSGGVFFLYIGFPHANLWTAFNAVAEEKRMQLSFFELVDSTSSENIFVYRDDLKLTFMPRNDLESSLRAWVETEQQPAYPKLTMLGIRQMEAEMSAARRHTESEKIRMRMPKTLVVFVVGQDAASNKLKSIGKSLAFDAASPLQKSFKFAWTFDVMSVNRLAMTSIETPNLFCFGPNEEIILHPKYAEINGFKDESHESLINFLEDVAANRVASYGGTGFVRRMKRFMYEMLTGVFEFMVTSPLLAMVVFGLPLGGLSGFFFYVCCSSFEDENKEFNLQRHCPAIDMTYSSTDSRQFTNHRIRIIGPVPSQDEIEVRRKAYLESKKDK